MLWIFNKADDFLIDSVFQKVLDFLSSRFDFTKKRVVRASCWFDGICTLMLVASMSRHILGTVFAFLVFFILYAIRISRISRCLSRERAGFVPECRITLSFQRKLGLAILAPFLSILVDAIITFPSFSSYSNLFFLVLYLVGIEIPFFFLACVDKPDLYARRQSKRISGGAYVGLR